MRLLELGLLYVVIGAGCSVAFVVFARGTSGRFPVGDVLLLVPFWPLYAPFLMMQPVREVRGAEEPTSVADALASRIAPARARIVEIDRLLLLPAFDEKAALERERALEASGDVRAAGASRARVASIRRLVLLRDRFGRELTEVDELLAQLRVQSEVVRLSGASSDGTRELVSELTARAEGLEAILADDLPV